ncbi:MAG TPA: type II toxin-antitoxin system VapC family toxin [Stellaceae bacterium]|nr:type II toxin-antitoxin system VapC family toxin [Stellaceae bacterium]
MSDDEIVADASAVLAALKNEPFNTFDPERIVEASISSVNLCEVLTKLIDDGLTARQADAAVATLELRIYAFAAQEAAAAAQLRPSTRASGLSLGDRACLALARTLDCTVVTADCAWAGLDIGVNVVLIR